MQPTILAIIGKPLSGKDTQADLLVAAHPEAVKISTGHIIRGVHEEGETHRFWPILGPYLSYMEQGLKLPDAPVIDMLGQVIQEQVAEGKKLLVIAGSPRSFDQLDEFQKIAENVGAKLALVHLNASDRETYRRSAARNEGRVDDTPEVHCVRLEEYNTHVLPVVEYLRITQGIKEFDAMKPADEVYRELNGYVREHLQEPEITLPMMARR